MSLIVAFSGQCMEAVSYLFPRRSYSQNYVEQIIKHFLSFEYSLGTKGQWIQQPTHVTALATYHRETGSTECSLPPSLHTCLQPSACHCRSSQTRLLLTPPRTYTLGHCCRRQHNAMGSCEVNTALVRNESPSSTTSTW